jgi:polyferredoxin
MNLQISPQNMDPVIVIPTLLLWLAISSLVVVLLRKGTLSKRISIILLGVSFIITGIILGAMPNSVSPINQFSVLIGLTSSQPLLTVLPMLLLLVVLLGSTVIFGRIYCSYACPLGAMQELTSKLFFKSDVKSKNKASFLFEPSTQIITPIRWIYLLLFVLVAFIWGLTTSEVMNLFVGFQIFQGTIESLLIFTVIFFIGILISSFFIYRPWCRFFCPFGTLASATNKFYQYKLVRTDNCTDCGLCETICPTQEAYRISTKAECYYCNRCIEICPSDAIIYAKAV